MNPHLAVMTVGYFLGILLTSGLSILVWLKGERNALSRLFHLMNISILLVEISVLGTIVAPNQAIANFFSPLNIMNIFIVVFMAHWVLEIIGKSKKRLLILNVIYSVGVLMFLAFLWKPALFLLPPVPKMYLPFYFEPGNLYTAMRVYFALVSFYFLYELFVAYRETLDNTVRNRIKYVFSGILFGMITGQIALFLVYNIEIDPLWSMLFPLYTIPFAYAIIRYELMDIRIVAKFALLYALSVSVIALFLGLLSFAADYITTRFPAFPHSALPVTASVIASGLGFFIWKRMRESEVLEHEFIATVTHKFRTPLTQIKWSVENLLSEKTLSPESVSELNAIAHANTSLVELTNTLIKTTESENTAQEYHFKKIDIGGILPQTLALFQNEISRKHLSLSNNIPPQQIFVFGDENRITLTVQTLIENAVMYTPSNGSIEIHSSDKEGVFELSVTDSGIGISREELPRIFTKFYRSEGAKRIMTEGMGIGLYIAKQITDRHGGRLSISSPGTNKGATFTLRLKSA